MKTSLFGSCVSRDVCRIALPNVQFGTHVSRQSFISQNSDASQDSYLHQIRFDSKFQQRSFVDDLKGNGIEKIINDSDVDILLIDLTDERLGVYISPDKKIITRIYEGELKKIYRNIAWKHVPFASRQHFRWFKKAIERQAKILDDAGLLNKAVVVDYNWAAKTVDGEDVPPPFGIQIEKMNKRYRKYYRVMEKSGFHMLRVPAELSLADPNHLWGIAPYHFQDSFYYYVAREMMKKVNK